MHCLLKKSTFILGEEAQTVLDYGAGGKARALQGRWARVASESEAGPVQLSKVWVLKILQRADGEVEGCQAHTPATPTCSWRTPRPRAHLRFPRLPFLHSRHLETQARGPLSPPSEPVGRGCPKGSTGMGDLGLGMVPDAHQWPPVGPPPGLLLNQWLKTPGPGVGTEVDGHHRAIHLATATPSSLVTHTLLMPTHQPLHPHPTLNTVHLGAGVRGSAVEELFSPVHVYPATTGQPGTAPES
ncbi:Mitotic Deacetylase-Associated Sant Domain Protein [Manis pentadactyla]|nr:Mitotic Deacetylase-Associated Sant Domain Protein [Manis pentadactyla]